MKLYFVELAIVDWSASVAWYRDVLGLKVLMRVEADRFAILQAGEARLALKQAAGPIDQVRGTGVLLTFEVEDLAAEVARLARHGVAAESPLQASAEGYRRALFRDPDGYRLCLFDWAAKKS